MIFPNCLHCEKEFTYEDYAYMVCDHIWKEAGFSYHQGYVHILCLENKIGRSLKKTDFMKCPLNHWVDSSWAFYDLQTKSFSSVNINDLVAYKHKMPRNYEAPND